MNAREQWQKTGYGRCARKTHLEGYLGFPAPEAALERSTEAGRQARRGGDTAAYGFPAVGLQRARRVFLLQMSVVIKTARKRPKSGDLRGRAEGLLAANQVDARRVLVGV
jgi:hypothetical protein